MKKQVEEQQEPIIPPTSLASTTHEESSPLFLEKRDVACTKSLQDLYKVTKRHDKPFSSFAFLLIVSQ